MEDTVKKGKGNVLRIIYILVFVCMISALSVLMPVVKSDMSREKRAAAKFPKFDLKFCENLDTYFTDNFAFRQQLSTLDATYKAFVFHTSNQPDRVVVGKDGWLFYDSDMHDYLGEDVLTARGAYSVARVLYLMQECCEAQGRTFAFACAPNKSSVYGEYMASNYLRTKEPTNYELIRDELKKQGVCFADLHSLFLNDERVMYHRYDSHWNNEGATVAVGAMLDAVGKSHYDYSSEPYTIQNNHRGDLYNILYPSYDTMDDNVIYEKEHTFRYLREPNSMEDPSIQTVNSSAEGSLLMFRDSYGNSAIPYVADEFAKGYFSWGQPADLSVAESQNADTVIYELVERNLPWLIMYLPYMKAPEREVPQQISTAEGATTTVAVEELYDRFIVYGVLDAAYTDDDSPVYVVIETDAGEKFCVEATPASYTMTKDQDEATYSYGAYISKDLLAGNFTASVVTKKDGKMYCTAVGTK